MEIDNTLYKHMNRVRIENGYLTIDEILELTQSNSVYDPFSLLITRGVIVGSGNVFYPSVLITSEMSEYIVIGNENIFYAGCMLCSKNGIITIGNSNEIGENGIKIKSEKIAIAIKDQCRLNNGAQIHDGCQLGNGSQVLGNIKVQECIVEDGESYRIKDPNQRGGVLKGFGYAKGLVVKKGEVICGEGDFAKSALERQETYHPNWREN